MDFIKLAAERYSVRSFEDRPVSPEILQFAAVSSSSILSKF